MSARVWCGALLSGMERFSAYGPVADSPEDREKYLQLSGRNRFGVELDASVSPLVLRAIDDPPPPLGHYNFVSGHFPLVSSDVVEVLKELDVGNGRFLDVRFEDQEGTPLPHNRLLWNFGNRKDTLQPDKCRNVSRIVGSPGRTIPEMYTTKGRLKDDDLAVGRAALAGPDIWVEPKFTDAVFFSDRFKEHLSARGFSDLFPLKSVREISPMKQPEFEGAMQ